MAQVAGFGKIFEIAPAFRADPSFTSRHATEFTSIDAEISWIDSHEDVAKMQEELLATAITAVKEKHGAEIEELFGLEVVVPAIPFPRIPLAEALEIVKSRGYEVPRTDGDLDPEGERQISAYVEETYGHQFVFITDYHPEIRAFYHMRDEQTGLTRSYDLLFKGVEITTGAQREHRVDVLIEQAKEKGLEPEHLDFYLDFFRYGTPPHGGFGMGLARVLMLLLGESSIREVTYLFRGRRAPRPLTPAPEAPRVCHDGRMIEGLQNFRDTGGTPLTGGGATRTGVLYRSEALSALTPEGLAQFAATDIGVIADFRTPRRARDGGRPDPRHAAVPHRASSPLEGALTGMAQQAPDRGRPARCRGRRHRRGAGPAAFARRPLRLDARAGRGNPSRNWRVWSRRPRTTRPPRSSSTAPPAKTAPASQWPSSSMPPAPTGRPWSRTTPRRRSTSQVRGPTRCSR